MIHAAECVERPAVGSKLVTISVIRSDGMVFSVDMAVPVSVDLAGPAFQAKYLACALTQLQWYSHQPRAKADA